LVRAERPEEALVHFRKYLELEPNAEDADQVKAEVERIEQS
jgi:hypothetical protein